MVQKATPLQGTHRERCRERVPAIRTVMKHEDAEKATKPAVMHTNGRMRKGRLTAETENGTSSSLNGMFWLIFSTIDADTFVAGMKYIGKILQYRGKLREQYVRCISF